MNPTLTLTIAALKMYYRNRQALFWTVVLPLMIMVMFGILNFGKFSDVDLGVVDEAHNQVSAQFLQALNGSDILDVTVGTRDAEIKALKDGDRDMVAILSPTFGQPGVVTSVQAFYADTSQRNAEVASSIIQKVLDSLTFGLTGTPQLFAFESQAVDSKGLEYVDFLVPGVVAMSIMQMGIFSITFSLIAYRQRGVLRRLKAAPIRPRDFLVGQVITRLLVSLLQTSVLLGVAVLLFDVNVVGNLGVIFLLALLGGALFLCVGFAVASVAKNEEVGAPLANVIAMPMMFMSGVFYPTDVLPGPLEKIVQFFPLTSLADGLREVSVQGAAITEIGWEFLGLGVWTLIFFLLAARVFRWE